MAQLTDKELDKLNKEVERGGLTYTELQEELLDHLCCDVEAKMDEGIEFIRALEEVKKEMENDCFRQIQEDTLLLINQKYRMMKKFMYVLGTISPTLVIIGTIFKIQHWPGASIMLTLGLTLLALVYIPVFVSIKIRDTREEGKKINKGVYYIGMISGIIFILGAMFKIMHWPGAGVMITLSGLVVAVVFIPMLVVNALRDKDNQVQSFTLLIFVLSAIAIIFMSFALRVSKSVMDSFVLAADDNTTTIEVLHHNNEALAVTIGGIDQDMEGPVTELTEKVDELSSFIDETIEVLILEVKDKNVDAIDGDGNIDYREVMNKDDANTTAHLMLGIDYDVARGEVVQRLMEEYKAYVSSLGSEHLDLMAGKLLDTEIPEGAEEYMTWVSHNFEHLPMMSVVLQLTNIQVNARILEAEILRHFLSKAAHGSIE